MKSRFLSVIALAAIVMASHATVAEAGRVFRPRIFRPRPHYVRQVPQTPPTTIYPRVRQIDGRSLWDLGKQHGEWPPLRF